ncbi:hypothetical protein MES5069_1340008 [Mesorhizobium escarrei]|uniref:Uncharacterized protein n=1 Tax=Mesorhizobium escarrei TaxID=666018 RepID=A0ABN8JFN4_9HYPH|nr:hypothetical protein MES5069_1340008 [Mesorhizobium escarrei]
MRLEAHRSGIWGTKSTLGANPEHWVRGGGASFRPLRGHLSPASRWARNPGLDRFV